VLQCSDRGSWWTTGHVLVHSETVAAGVEGGFFSPLREWVRRTFFPSSPGPGERLEVTRVFDMTSGAELFHLAAARAGRVAISPDARTLIESHSDRFGEIDEMTLTCYDLPQQRPWLKIAGIPLAAGAVLV